MPTSKKRASSKSKKASSKNTPTIEVQGSIPKIKMDFALDNKKVAAIQRCLAKGQLSIQVSRVDLSAGRLGEAWEYD
jgi:anti-sigma28 factor (negative regulator of flagellin synthesis)